MNYELAKKLNDAGFYSSRSIEPMVNIAEKDRWISPNGDFYHLGCIPLPTLSELIEACGDMFYSLENRGGTWRVEENRMHPNDYDGFTPEEAVAKLWLATHEKGI